MTTREAIRELTAIQQINIRSWSKEALEAIDKAVEALGNIDDCRNELCYKCGNYKQSHLGACNDCRWKR